MQCFNCWETGHRKQQCKNDRKCRVCRETGHARGSSGCKHYVDPTNSGDVIAFQEKSHTLSYFYPCHLNVFGEKHKSAEHAYQMTKAIRTGDLEAAKVREAGTALYAKRIGHSVKDPEGWHKEKETVKEEIVSAKVEQIPEVKPKLENFNSSTIFAEGHAVLARGALDWMSMALYILTIKSGPAKTNLEKSTKDLLLNSPENS